MTTDAQPLPDEAAPELAPAEQLPAIFPKLPVTMGDYKLTHLLGSHRYSDFYVAKQSHVERRVVLEVLRPLEESDGSQEQQFLSHARARVAARPPHTAQVLESTTSPEGYCYISQQLPEGTTLASMAADGRCLTIPQACALIHTAGELYEACANTGLAAGPLRADMIFINRSGEFAFLSPVLDDAPVESDSLLQMQMLAAAILPVLPSNATGQNRVITLLSWMTEGYEGQQLDWPAAANTATLIAEQLKPQSPLHISRPLNYDKGRIERANQREKKRKRLRTTLVATAITTIIAMAVAGAFFSPYEAETLPAVRGGEVLCKVEGELKYVSARPVSIEQYQRYLLEWPDLPASRRGSVAMNIPPAESDPTPADWEAMLAAAQEGKEWQGRQLSMESPVTNVSYWQALMFARYQRAKLPEATLLMAVRAQCEVPGVEEWTQDTRPAALPYGKAHIVLPDTLDASPTPESDSNARTPQRGFRTCR